MNSDNLTFSQRDGCSPRSSSSPDTPMFSAVSGSTKGKGVARLRKEMWVGDGRGQLHRKTTIGTLPDYVLLETFNFYVDEGHRPDIWHVLVHVCRRWRYLVFASPRYLKLQLLCTNRRSVPEMLDIWPALPIFIIWDNDDPADNVINIIAALNQRERVCRVDLWQVGGLLWEICAAAMQKTFPELTELALRLVDETAEILPDTFLGGTSPRLRSLDLNSVPFPALNNLLLSAKDLVTLRLWDIPHSGYISPEEMLTCLLAMPRLETLRLGFRSFQSRPTTERTSRCQPPLARQIHPALTQLRFKGGSEYLEGLISRIDVPLLQDLVVKFFDQSVFNTPQLLRFIDRTEAFKALNEAVVIFSHHSVEIILHERVRTAGCKWLALEILCSDPDWQLSCLAQACTSTLSPVSPLLESLEILYHRRRYPRNAENAQWLDLLRPFSAVKNLYLSAGLVTYILFALKATAGGRVVVEVLPALQNIFSKGFLQFDPLRTAVETFVVARERFGRPVSFKPWETDESNTSVMANCGWA